MNSTWVFIGLLIAIVASSFAIGDWHGIERGKKIGYAEGHAAAFAEYHAGYGDGPMVPAHDPGGDGG